MKFQKQTLPNGLRYILIPMKNTETVTTMVLVGTGSEYESEKENGLAHFLEHMCFKGTTKRPTAHAISYELDSLGANYNAFTGGVYTGYYAKGHKKHAVQMLDIISDIYLNSTFPESEMNKEKNVIVQEINMREDHPRAKASEVMDELLYSHQPAGRPITGTKDSVLSFERSHLVEYHQKHYVPGNTLVIISGAFAPDAMKKHIASRFGMMKKMKVIKKVPTEVAQNKPAIKVHCKETEQTHINIAFRAFDIFDKRVSAGLTLSVALGGGMSSRLFMKIREELGLCYSIDCSLGVGIDEGTFGIRAAVGNDKVEAAIEAILNELRRIRDEGIQEPELRKVKDYRLSGLVLGLETSDDYAEHYGFQELTENKIRTPKDSAERIEKVKLKEVQSVAKDIFKEGGMNIVIVGPHKDSQAFKHLLKFPSK